MEFLGIEIDATFIALVAFTIFFAVMIYLKVPGMVLSALDQRSAAIAKELHDARRLREEAEKLLADYKAKHAAAETEAKAIVDAAKSLKASLIVMSTHGRTGMTHLLLGSELEERLNAIWSPDLQFVNAVETKTFMRLKVDHAHGILQGLRRCAVVVTEPGNALVTRPWTGPGGGSNPGGGQRAAGRTSAPVTLPVTAYRRKRFGPARKVRTSRAVGVRRADRSSGYDPARRSPGPSLTSRWVAW